jgi:hypothetical protein
VIGNCRVEPVENLTDVLVVLENRFEHPLA